MAIRRTSGVRELLERGLRYLQRELSRSLPHGLFNWRYLVPGCDARVRSHRHLWWTSPSYFPRPIWLLLETWLWLRWICFDAWRSTWWAVRTLGPDVKKHEGLTLPRQAWRTITLSLAWCIPPSQIYAFKLYRNPASALDYVFDHEIAAYHAWRSRALGFTRPSLMLLQDKQALSQKLAAAGLPMAPTLTCVPRFTATSILAWLQDGTELFCKTRSGSRSFGAFSVWQSAEGLRGRMHKGTSLNTEAEVESAWQALLKLDDALVQPRLRNHPILQRLCPDSDVVTLRFISQRRDETWHCLSATLEVPVEHEDKTGSPHYTFLPIEPVSGRLQPFPFDALVTEADRRVAANIAALLDPDSIVPEWATIIEHSYRAHTYFPDVCEIAWDWVVTPEGPRLLEGNAGWGTEVLQTLQGGLLSKH